MNDLQGKRPPSILSSACMRSTGSLSGEGEEDKEGGGPRAGNEREFPIVPLPERGGRRRGRRPCRRRRHRALLIREKICALRLQSLFFLHVTKVAPSLPRLCDGIRDSFVPARERRQKGPLFPPSSSLAEHCTCTPASLCMCVLYYTRRLSKKSETLANEETEGRGHILYILVPPVD